MKPIQLNEFDNILLHKPSLIETVYDPLKNISQLEHSRHRSMLGFISNLLSSIISYPWQPKKPSLNLRQSSSANDLLLLDHSLYVSEVQSFSACSYIELTLSITYSQIDEDCLGQWQSKFFRGYQT